MKQTVKGKLLRDISLMSEDERDRVLFEWNRTEAPFPDYLCLHQLFELQAKASPDAIAVCMGDSALTYEQLDRRASLLAACLQKQGVMRRTFVGVFLRRSLDLMVAILGILKAGAAYVPLEPEYPVSALAFMVEDSSVPVVITSEDLAEQAHGLCPQLFVMGEELQASTCAAPSEVSPHDPVYMIYTSGSTGRPKGVVNLHRGLVNRIEWMRQYFRVTSGDRILHKTSISFDVSVWELFLPLAAGGTLIMAPPGVHRDLNALQELIVVHGVTMMHFVPSLLATFVEQPGLNLLPSLRFVISSGEALPLSLANRFYERLGCELANLYGPTEASIDVTCWICPRQSDGQTMPLGRPIANTQIYILDGRLEPVPIGVVGEICLAGAGLALGYWKRPDLTAQRFVPNPFVSGERIYCTGDLGRYSPDGLIEFLGRRDEQVKIRGYRIELGEVEAVLREHPDVREAGLSHRFEHGKGRLYALVVCRDQVTEGPEGDERREQLREFLRQRLPDYMLPGVIRLAKDLPFTGSGKLDRKRVAELAAEEIALEQDRAYTAPRGELECLLADTWAGLLQRNRIGRDDNFFELGGDSITSIQVVAQLRRRGYAIEVKDIFDSPTIARLTARIAPLAPPVQPAAPDGESGVTLTGLSRSEFDGLLAKTPGAVDAFPLSPMQEGMLFRSAFLPESDVYLNQNVLELTGDLDEGLMKSAWQVVLNHYEVLRSCFRWESLRQPLQMTIKPVEIPWHSYDWRDVPADSLGSRTEELMAADRRSTFDLSRAPLLRLQCIRLEQNRWRLLWSHHHILIDGWCLSLIWSSVFTAYENLLAGRSPELPAVRPFRDYIQWLYGQSQDEAARFWRQYLEGFETPSWFTPKENYLPSEYRTEIVNLTEEMTTALAGLARNSAVTLSCVIQAAWALLLYTECQCSDVVFGISVSGRPPELDGSAQMVGLFINTVPLRVKLDRGITVRNLLQNLHSGYSKMLRYSHLPLAVIKTLTPSPSIQPIFDSLIAFENYPEDSLPVGRVAGLTIRDLMAHEKTEYPMGLIVLPGLSLALHFNYDTDIFPSRKSASLIRRFTHILERMLIGCDQSISDLSLLPDDEERRVTREWNRTGRSYPAADNTRQLFERQVDRRPEAVAIVTGERQWSYAEVEAWANRIAHRLRSAGVVSGSRVLVSLQRSAELIVSLLAVWKAGGIYTPIDGSQPLARRQWMTAESDAAALVARDAGEGARLGFRGPVIGVEQHEGSEPESRLDLTDAGEEVAYMMFTSGTSGPPKGVLCRHQGLINRVEWSLESLALGESDVVLHNAAVGFDIALWEMIGPLAAGARVVVLEEGRQREIGEMIAEIRRHRVTVMHLVPSLLEVLLEHPEAGGCETLREVITGGEVTPVKVWTKLQERLPWSGLQHAYGPTEATISVTWWECRRGENEGRIPLGRPIANVRMYVLDPWRRPVPAGVSGELYIGGVAVAAGYWKQDELTAERFVESPFEAGERLYRTGDWGRWTEEGLLEYEGRRDRQVKVRGQRIELGEVEWALGELEGVRQAVVEAPAQDGGEMRLQAWVVCETGGVEEQELQQRLRAMLPEHMVPSHIALLDQFPLTPNGKIDRRALLASTMLPAPVENRKMPKTPVQGALWNIWSELLKSSDFGIDSDFFELGGHSLLAIRFAVRAEREFGPGKLNITHIFKNPTIAALANIIENTAHSPCALFAISGSRESLPLILVHPGEGLAYAYRGLAKHLEGVQLWAIHNPRFGDRADPFESVEQMAREYLVYVREQFGHGPYVLGGWSFGGVIAFEMARQLEADGEAAAPVVLIDSYHFPELKNPLPTEGEVRQHLAAADREDLELGPFVHELMTSGALAMRYSPQPFSGQVILIQAQDVEPRWIGREGAQHNGWLTLAPRGIEIYQTPGAHGELFDDAHVSATAATLSRVLAAISRTGTEASPQ